MAKFGAAVGSAVNPACAAPSCATLTATSWNFSRVPQKDAVQLLQAHFAQAVAGNRVHVKSVTMANEEQVKVLKQGPDFWNAWRKQNPTTQFDFSGANLSGVNLSGVILPGSTMVGMNLQRADLTGADLRDSDLRGTDLRGAVLAKADLNRALLLEANLQQANLVDADLRAAHLNSADLSKADLSGALLRRVDLTGAHLMEAIAPGVDLRESTLTGTDLRSANFSGADFSRSILFHANLSEADLRWCYLWNANLSEANLNRAKLIGAHLNGAHLGDADLSHVDATGAVLEKALLVNTNLQGARLTGCHVYGISVWDVELEGADQRNLVITPDGVASIQVDNLEVAQFIYLILNNEKIRHVIDTITSKVVLILGRFTPERKAVLDAIKDELRKHDYLPVLVDFEKPHTRDLTETVRALAHLSRFVVADITDAKSIAQELTAIVPNLPSLPVQPLLLASEEPYGMFEHFRRYPWVLDPFLYKDIGALLTNVAERVIAPAERYFAEKTIAIDAQRPHQK